MKNNKEDAQKVLHKKETEQVQELIKKFFNAYMEDYDGIDDAELFKILNNQFKMRVAYMNKTLRTFHMDFLHFEKSIDIMKSEVAGIPSIGQALTLAEDKLNAIHFFVQMYNKEPKEPENILAGITEIFYPKPPVVEEPAKLEAVKD